jgi:TonB family protein
MRSISFLFLMQLMFVVDSSLGQVTFYFDKDDTEIDSAMAEYSVTYVDQGSISHFLRPKLLRYTENENGEKKKTRTYYYKSGEIRGIVDLTNGAPDGSTRTFYENGTAQSELIFEGGGFLNQPVVRVINYWDSAGNKLIADGMGFCNCDLDPLDDRQIIETGRIVNQLKEGEWTASTDKYSFLDVYENGVLKNGVQIYEGVQYEYEKIMVAAQPIGGIIEFYRHVGKVVRYPSKARRNGTQGKVFIQFVVQKDGSLSNIRILKGIGSGCDEEALRAVATSPKWQPAQQRGRLVKQRYTLPIMFQLGR